MLLAAIAAEAETKGEAVIDLLEDLLKIRALLYAAKDKAEGYGCLAELPELESMRKLERIVFGKVNEWEKPD